MDVDREYLIALGFLSYVKKIVEGRVKIEKKDNLMDETFGQFEIKGLENITDEELVVMLSVILRDYKEVWNDDYSSAIQEAVKIAEYAVEDYLSEDGDADYKR